MPEDTRRAIIRAERLQEHLQAVTGDTDYTVEHADVPAINNDERLYIGINHPLITHHDCRNLRSKRDFGDDDQLLPNKQQCLEETIRRIAYRRTWWQGSDWPEILDQGHDQGAQHLWTHPLTLALLLPLNQNDRTRAPTDIHGDQVKQIRDMLASPEIWLTHNGEMQVSSKPYETSIVLENHLPETVIAAAAGRRLLDVVDIRPTGYQDVDTMVENMVIEHTENKLLGTWLRLRAVDWILYDGAEMPSTDRPYQAANRFDPNL